MSGCPLLPMEQSGGRVSGGSQSLLLGLPWEQSFVVHVTTAILALSFLCAAPKSVLAFKGPIIH